MSKLTPLCYSVASYIAENINNYNIDKSVKEKIFINGNKLQKILYFCDIEYMKSNNGISMFKDDFYAWPKGPTIPEIYYIFWVNDKGVMCSLPYQKEPLTINMKKTIDEVLELMGSLDTIELINLTQVEGGPWSKVYNEDDKKHEQIISKEEMFKFYSNNEENKKQRFKFFAVPSRRPFIVAPDKVEAFKNSTNNKEDNEFVKKLAETFKKNNLVEDKPKVKKIGQKTDKK